MSIFDDYYRTNFWNNQESVSGNGSTLAATKQLRQQLRKVFVKYRVESILDIPCGDFNWAREVMAGFYYIGADIVPELIEDNRRRYPNWQFETLDITTNLIPAVDLVLVRDLFGHLPNYKVKMALHNLRRSHPTYLLVTTFPEHHNSGDIAEGQWRPINMAEYWGLGVPLDMINEGCEIAGLEDKSLGLWRL